MIPKKLSIKNFLCYKDNVPILDLEGIHVACLCGPNGHGKSALLDAITWGLWGKARGKINDDLIHFGKQDMEISLDFLVGDVLHRVVRRYSRGTSKRTHGSSDLQLQIQAGSEFNTITGNTIRETQAIIERLIAMDYETFVNSSFLLQGRADQFTNNTPGERKEVLSKILGLGRYDALQNLAKIKVDELNVQLAEIEAKMVGWRAELVNEDEYVNKLTQIKSLLDANTVKLEAVRVKRDATRVKVGDLRQRTEQRQELSQSANNIRKEIEQLKTRSKDLSDRILVKEGVLKNRDKIEKRYERLQDLKNDQQTLNKSLQTVHELDLLRKPLTVKINVEHAKLQERYANLSKTVHDLKDLTSKIPESRIRIEETKADLEKLNQREKIIATQRGEIQELDSKIGQYGALTEKLKEEGEDIASKLTLLNESDKRHNCPLCQAELGKEGKQMLSSNYEIEISEKRKNFQTIKENLKLTQAQKMDLQEYINKSELSLKKSLQESNKTFNSLEKDLRASLDAESELKKLEIETRNIHKIIDNEKFSIHERNELQEIDAKIQATGFDPKVLERINQEIDQLDVFNEEYSVIKDAVKELPGEKENLLHTSEMISRREHEYERYHALLDQLVVDVENLPVQESTLKSLDRQHAILEDERAGILSSKGDLEGNVARLKELSNLMNNLESEAINVRGNYNALSQIAEAFGKRGVQAMLIESIIPKLEERSNVLLGRMTENRMHIKLETQRETRGGEIRETLDINIADELGTRSYEMFSGGEAFRINLALRVALSKVLAERGGMPSLPTLFIDEGFGTQDVVGRERMLDVIQAIQSDFQMIIVITHLDDIKEAFPVRIEVDKTESGSTFSIN